MPISAFTSKKTSITSAVVIVALLSGCGAATNQTPDTTATAADVTEPASQQPTPSTSTTTESPTTTAPPTTASKPNHTYGNLDADLYSKITDLDRVPMKVALVRAIAHEVPQCQGIEYPLAPVSGGDECKQAASAEATRRIAKKTSPELAEKINMEFVSIDMFGNPDVDEKALQREANRCMVAKYPGFTNGGAYVFSQEKARLLGMSGPEEYLAELEKGKGDPADKLSQEQRNEYARYADKVNRTWAKCNEPSVAADYDVLLKMSQEMYAKHPELRPAVEDIINSN